MRNLPRKKGYKQHLDDLDDSLYYVYHVRGINYNIAVAVLSDGSYYVGTAALNPIDQYNHKLGHEIAVGRALFNALNDISLDMPHRLWEDKPLTGKDLSQACKKVAEEAAIELEDRILHSTVEYIDN